MKKQNSQDERVVAERRKIQSDAYGIVFFALLLSVVIQQFILNAPFQQYAVEFICFIGMGAYITIRNMTLGINIYGEGKRAKILPFVNSIVTGTIVTVINGVLNYTQYAEKYQKDGIGYFIAVLVTTFVSATAAALVVMLILNYLTKKKQKKIQMKLDKDEQDE